MRLPGVVKRDSIYWAIAVVFACAGVAVQASTGDFVARPLLDPEPPGLVVKVELGFFGDILNSILLSVTNESTSLLTLDASRSSVTTPDGRISLDDLVGDTFATSLRSGASTSARIHMFVVVDDGDLVELVLVWSLKDRTSTARWSWETNGFSHGPAVDLSVTHIVLLLFLVAAVLLLREKLLS
jgi:hypothetical protein